MLIPATLSTPHRFTLPRIGDFLISNRVTLALSGADDPLNDAGGLRLARTSAALRVLTAVPVTNHPPSTITNYMLGLGRLGATAYQINFLGTPGSNYSAQFTVDWTNWLDFSTNTAGTDGVWSVTDGFATNGFRFYRSLWRRA